MEEKDFQRIEQMIGKAVKDEVGKAVKTELGSFRTEIDTKFEQNDLKLDRLRKDINEDFRHHVGILTEDFHHKLQLVAKGHQTLHEKIERVQKGVEKIDTKIDGMAAELGGSIRQLDKKLDSVAADLAAHRSAAEGHKRGYQVSEP